VSANIDDYVSRNNASAFPYAVINGTPCFFQFCFVRLIWNFHQRCIIDCLIHPKMISDILRVIAEKNKNMCYVIMQRWKQNLLIFLLFQLLFGVQSNSQLASMRGKKQRHLPWTRNEIWNRRKINKFCFQRCMIT
jgi:hypothetical protein